VTHVFLQCGLQRVVHRIAAALKTKNQGRQPDKGDALRRIGHRVSCEFVHRVRGTGKEGLIVVLSQGQVCALRAGVGE